jgi:hypothetical protein
LGAAAAVLILRFKLLPRWLAPLAVLLFLGGLAPWIAVPVLALWVLVVSIVPLVKAGEQPPLEHKLSLLPHRPNERVSAGDLITAPYGRERRIARRGSSTVPRSNIGLLV